MADEVWSLDRSLDFLKEGTKFSRVSEIKMMHTNPKVATPLHAINAVLGGGIPFGSIIEGFGPPDSFKSTFFYMVVAEFQKSYPDGIAIIMDTETSVDPIRCTYLGIDNEHVLRLPALVLEEGFEQIFQILKKKSENEKTRELPCFIMWDTISAAPTRKQFEEGRVNAGGLTEKPRLIKSYLSDLFVLIDQQPIIFVLLNQVFLDFSGFRPKLVSGGGYGLKHDIHLQLEFSKGQTFYSGPYMTWQTASCKMTKSKLSPKLGDFHIGVDTTKGGVINKETSFIEYCKDVVGFVSQAGSWYKISKDLLNLYPEYLPILDNHDKSWRWSELADYLRDSERYIKFFQLALVDLLGRMYKHYFDITRDYRNHLYLYLQKELIMNKFWSDNIPYEEWAINAESTFSEVETYLGEVAQAEKERLEQERILLEESIHRGIDINDENLKEVVGIDNNNESDNQ